MSRLRSDLPTRHLTRGLRCAFRQEVRTQNRHHVLRGESRKRKGTQTSKEKRQREIRNVHVNKSRAFIQSVPLIYMNAYVFSFITQGSMFTFEMDDRSKYQ